MRQTTRQSYPRHRENRQSIVKLEPGIGAVGESKVISAGWLSTRATTARNPETTARRQSTQKQSNQQEMETTRDSNQARRSSTRRVRFETANEKGDKQLWSRGEVQKLAQLSLKYWSKGQMVDYKQAALDMQRREADIQVMLQLVLEEHELCASSYWRESERQLVRMWAAKEFPKSLVLNQKEIKKSMRGPNVWSRCISVFNCQKPAASESWVVDEPIASETSSQSTETEPAETVISDSPNSTALLAVGTETSTKQTEEQHNNTKPQPQQTTTPPASEFTFRFPPTQATKQPTELRKNINVISRNTRILRQQSRRSHRAKSSKAASSNPTVSNPAVSNPADEEKAACSLSVKTIDNEADTTQSYVSDLLGLGTAISGLEQGMREVELSPEQSTDTYDLNRLDGDIDIEFFDVTAPNRKFIRDFVEDYVEKHFEIFFYRAIRPDISDRLYRPISGNEVQLAANPLVDELEKELLQLGGLDTMADPGSRVDLHGADLHFHMQFARSVLKCNIFEGDPNWLSANHYATAVFNRMIEDAHYLAFEAIDTTSQLSEISRNVHYWRTGEMSARANAFKRRYLLGIVASQLTTRFVQGPGRRVFLERVHQCGYKPVPTAADYDDDMDEEALQQAMSNPWANVSIRGELHGLMMDMLPFATNESTMIMMQRAIEIYNKTIVSFMESTHGSLRDVFVEPLEEKQISRRVLESVERNVGAVSVAQLSKMAQWLADLWFDRLKHSLLRALMADYPLRPVPLASVRRWIAEDRGPQGKSIDFVLNTRLYTYLKHLRIRMSHAKWLYASAAATLRMLERAKSHLSDPQLLTHIDIPHHVRLFRSCIAQELGLESAAVEADEIPVRNPPSSACSPDTPAAQELLVDTSRDIGVSHMRLDQLAQAAAAAAACPAPSISIPTSPKAANPSEIVYARLSLLEKEVAGIRNELHNVSNIHRDIHSIFTLLQAQQSRL
ncbi:hypothetical protein IWW36_003720 [Coemansia brasiliensis]|uniref:Uncharacterized protein n=1 Tax=Coemansia brasiliensis TaxID=2650707 RepID=A0A9W8LZH1_9FUNG|nr:hypothetical protein IWW36_003720 [Coemansia brasiliensis]